MSKDLWAKVEGPDETKEKIFRVEIGKKDSLPSPREVVGLILAICEDILMKHPGETSSAEAKKVMIDHIKEQDLNDIETLTDDEAREAMARDIPEMIKYMKNEKLN